MVCAHALSHDDLDSVPVLISLPVSRKKSKRSSGKANTHNLSKKIDGYTIIEEEFKHLIWEFHIPSKIIQYQILLIIPLPHNR